MPRRDPKKLSPAQKRFVDQFLIDNNASRAAIRAGYSKNGARQIGYKLLQRPAVKAAVESGLAKLAAKAEVTAERVIGELAKIGFSNLQTMFDEAGDLIPVRDLPAEAAAALSSVEVEEIFEGSGEKRARVGRVRKIKLYDKRAALVDLGKHLGLFKELHEHTGKDGGPIEYSNIERARRLMYLLKKAAEEERSQTQAANDESP